jgi:ParB family chromosome partitioning protein
VAVLEDEEPQDFERAEAEGKIAELEAQLRTIASQPPTLEPEVRGTVGFFLMLDEAGVPRLDRTPYALVHQANGDVAEYAEGENGSSKGGSHAAGGHANGNGGASDTSGGGPATAHGATATPRLPQRLVDELAMQRRDILALHLAREPGLAFDLAVFLMVKDEGGYCFGHTGSSLSARAPSDPVLRSALPDAPAQALLAEADAALDRSWTNHEELTDKFAAFRALPRAAREAWLGLAIARTLEASAGEGGRQCAFHDHLGQLLAIDVAQHWRPTALNWFDRVPKALCLAALTEVGGPELAARHAKSKKAEIAEACEKVFAGEAIVDAQVKAAALAWAPGPMRFAAASECGDGTPPWEVEAGEDAQAVEDLEAARPDAGADTSSAHAGSDPDDSQVGADTDEPIDVAFEADDPALAGAIFAPDHESDPCATDDEAGAEEAVAESNDGTEQAPRAAPDADPSGITTGEHGTVASTAKPARPKRQRRKGGKTREADTPLDEAA